MRQRTHDLASNPLESAFPMSIAGLGIKTNPVYWDADAAVGIVADWESVLIGARKDITFTMHTDGVLQNDDGSIAMNLLQHTTAMRCVMRIGHHLATPVNGSGVAGVPVAAVVPPVTP